MALAHPPMSPAPRHYSPTTNTQEVGFFDQARVGELISRLGGDTTVLKDAATSNISMALRWGATVIGGTAYLFFVSWKLTLVMLIIVPAVAVSARLYGK